jgi:hypothetical protein
LRTIIPSLLNGDAGRGMALLGVTGILAATSMLLLGAHLIPGMHIQTTVELLLLVQWHALGWAISKAGVDYAVFGIVSRDPGLTFDLAKVLKGPMIPLWAGFTICSLLIYGWQISLALGLALFSDTLSAIRNAELNARRKFLVTSVGNLLYYPLFVLLWMLAALCWPATLLQGLLLLALCSAVRLIWFIGAPQSRDNLRPAVVTRHFVPATQGLLNMAMFRSDQVLLATITFTGYMSAPPIGALAVYVFLCRVIDIATGFMVIVGTVNFPKYPLQGPALREAGFRKLGIIVATFSALTTLGGAAVFWALKLYGGDGPTPGIVIAFCLQIPLIFMANFLTYCLQRDQRFHALLRNQALAIAAGCAVLACYAATENLVWLAWVVPTQLLIFSALGLIGPWGHKHQIHSLSNHET